MNQSPNRLIDSLFSLQQIDDYRHYRGQIQNSNKFYKQIANSFSDNDSIWINRVKIFTSISCERPTIAVHKYFRSSGRDSVVSLTAFV